MNKSDTEIPKISLPGSTLAAIGDISTCGNKVVRVSVPTHVSECYACHKRHNPSGNNELEQTRCVQLLVFPVSFALQTDCLWKRDLS